MVFDRLRMTGRQLFDAWRLESARNDRATSPAIFSGVSWKKSIFREDLLD
jgi:hypothetical protein